MWKTVIVVVKCIHKSELSILELIYIMNKFLFFIFSLKDDDSDCCIIEDEDESEDDTPMHFIDNEAEESGSNCSEDQHVPICIDLEEEEHEDDEEDDEEVEEIEEIIGN